MYNYNTGGVFSAMKKIYSGAISEKPCYNRKGMVHKGEGFEEKEEYWYG